MSDLEFSEVATAYFDCRKGKRKATQALDFEFNLEENLWTLFEELKDNTYKISPSVVFVVEQPKIREIWAGAFRDRIVHHVIYNRLSPRFYPTFIRHSFACIPGRGVLDGSNQLVKGLRCQTRSWQQSSYYLQGDIRNFFVSIDKQILFDLLKPKIEESWLFDLTSQVLFNDPRINCIRKSTTEQFARVPGHKTLFKTPAEKGLPIGNLTSQFFANVYLNELDQFVKHKLKAKHYYRYVDDFVVLDDSPKRLNQYFFEIESFLKSNLELELHPFKKRVAPISQGIDFIGFVHKPYHRKLRPRTISKMTSLVRQWEKSPNAFSDEALVKIRNSMNSYFGLSKWAASFKLRQQLGEKVRSLFIAPDKKYLKLTLNKLGARFP